MEGNSMLRLFVALLLLLAAQQANAAECGSTANRAGCVGPNGAATYNKNTGMAHTAQPYHSNEVVPGAHAEGRRGNSATKAVEPGCAFVNGRRVCNQFKVIPCEGWPLHEARGKDRLLPRT